MKTSLFNYELPQHLIAQQPLKKRDSSRMLVIDRANNTIKHSKISDIQNFLEPNDCLVFNNTKVIPARLFGTKNTGGKVEILLLEEKKGDIWRALLKSSRRPVTGTQIELCEGEVKAEIISDGIRGEVLIHINSKKPFFELIKMHGVPPLPPYIHRKEKEDYLNDKDRYQTVYASKPGSAAAPTAGLHFTSKLIDKLKRNNINSCEITLHVGLGTFRPVTSENINEHIMHGEYYDINQKTSEILNNTKSQNGRIVAIGSTSARTLESLPEFKASSGITDIFIHPPYNFKHTDCILTNFHLPQSTLLMMMAAFSSREMILRAYDEAINHNYRFFSYGDCMLIL